MKHPQIEKRIQSSLNFHLFTLCMSLEQGTKLRNGKVIDSPPEDNTSTQSVMTEPNIGDSDSNDNSDISSQLTEINENYERKISDLQSEFSQLKDLMMAIIGKANEDSPASSSQGTSKQPRSRLDNKSSQCKVIESMLLIGDWSKQSQLHFFICLR